MKFEKKMAALSIIAVVLGIMTVVPIELTLLTAGSKLPDSVQIVNAVPSTEED